MQKYNKISHVLHLGEGAITAAVCVCSKSPSQITSVILRTLERIPVNLIYTRKSHYSFQMPDGEAGFRLTKRISKAFSTVPEILFESAAQLKIKYVNLGRGEKYERFPK